MRAPLRALSVIVPDKRVYVEYANGHINTVDFYANSTMESAFSTAMSNAGHDATTYWAIQYSDGQQEIEYSNGDPNSTISSNTGLSEYTSLVGTWTDTLAEETRIANVPTWDTIRKMRDSLLTDSDKIIAWSTETGNAVPSAWTTYRTNLRDLTTTYGAPSGNTELVVFPSEPAWPGA